MSNRDEKKLINELHNMPDFVDSLDKEELYKQILLRLSDKNSPKRRKKIFIPIIAAAAVLFLLISLPFIINTRNDQATSSNDASDFQESALMREESSDDAGRDSSENNEESLNDAEIIIEKSEAMEDIEESRVLETIPLDSEMKNFTIYDEQLQFAIPITLITAADEDTAASYDEIRNILKSNNLSPDAELKETTFTNLQEASYMIYQNQYFVPISRDEATPISKAINTLKTAIPESDIRNTIPAEVDFRIDADHPDELLLEYIGNEDVEESSFTVTMIESILLTAKSYGYESVLFQAMPIDEVGMYQFFKAIDVPIGVNPIYLQY